MLFALSWAIFYNLPTGLVQHAKLFKKYRISSNNSGGRLFLFLHKKGVIIRGRRLFQILLTGSRALNILFYFPIKSKNNHVK